MAGNSHSIDIANDPILTEIVQGYMPLDQQYIAGQLLPTIVVQSRRGRVLAAGTDYLRIVKTLRVGRGKAPEITVTLSKDDAWQCEDEALRIPVLKEDGEQFNPTDWRAGMSEAQSMYAKMLTTNMMLSKEVGVAAALTSVDFISQNITLSGTSQFSDYSSSNPIDQIRLAKSAIRSATGRVPNVAYMGWEVAETLRYHPALLAMLSTTNDAKLSGLSDEQLAKVLGVNKACVGQVFYESAAEGQASSMVDVWGKDMGLMYVNPNPNPQQFEFSAGYDFELDELTADTYPENEPKDSIYVRVQRSRDQVILRDTAIYLIKSAVA